MEDGSSNVTGYISALDGQGSIGYTEDAYALASGLPALELQNPDGKYVLPTPANDATALTAATINEDASNVNYLQQNLAKVYTNKAAGSYPLASFSYLIVPRAGIKVPPIFNDAAGRSLSTFIDYAVCQGQKQLSGLGYAPLPASLVTGALEQAAHIPGHVPPPTLAACTH
jgi:ABC-type phosphate transport system substrate-binding protein